MDVNYIEISGRIKAETDKAVLFYGGNVQVWIPKSQIEGIERVEEGFTITIKEWLAEEKGLI